ncbi:hypothetical protein [Catellatospora methionotrophica]|uniref:hypothetical protein n=1 Tax=Catellatospora methionotrophica TaxID=121620 RepID=UPI0033C619FC
MAEQDRLERSYRRLLWAYPRYYRRERGLEILTTLLDAARPGRDRPTRGDTVHLILSGLRFRLVPPGWAAKIATGVAALWFAVVLGSAGAYVAWLPSARSVDVGDPRLAALADGLVGRPPERAFFDSGEPLDFAHGYTSTGLFWDLDREVLPGGKPVPSGQHRSYPTTFVTGGVMKGALPRLQADGWQVGPITRSPYCGCVVFWADRDGLLLRMQEARTVGLSSVVSVEFFPVEPEGVTAAAVAGFVIGLLTAWPVLAALTRHCTRVSNRDRLLLLAFGLPALFACFANTLDNVLSAVPDTEGVLLAADLLYPLANQAVNPVAAMVIAAGFAGCVAVVARSAWRRRHATTSAMAARPAAAGR